MSQNFSFWEFLEKMVLCYIKSSYAKSDLTIELALLKVVQDGLHSLAIIAQTTLIKINEN